MNSRIKGTDKGDRCPISGPSGRQKWVRRLEMQTVVDEKRLVETRTGMWKRRVKMIF